MSQIEVPEEIEHLDFEPKEDIDHFYHPTIVEITWCGHPYKEVGYGISNGDTAVNPKCPQCIKLLNAFGGAWWWETHRKHFGSNCTTRNSVIYHDCGA